MQGRIGNIILFLVGAFVWSLGSTHAGEDNLAKRGTRFRYTDPVGLALAEDPHSFLLASGGRNCTHVVSLASWDHILTEAFHQVWAEERNQFYGTIDRTTYRAVVKGRGLDRWADFFVPELRKMLTGEGGYPQIENLLVLGGGYGRDLDWLQAYTDIPNIWVLEASETNYNYLRRQYAKDSKWGQWRKENSRRDQTIWILGEDLTRDPFPQDLKFDFILASFGTWTELSPWEKMVGLPNLARASHPGTRFAADAPRGKTRSVLQITKKGPYIEMRPENNMANFPAARLHPFLIDSDEAIIDRKAFADSISVGDYFTLAGGAVLQYNAECEPEVSGREWFIHTRTRVAAPPLPPPQVLAPRPRDYQPPREWERMQLDLN